MLEERSGARRFPRFVGYSHIGIVSEPILTLDLSIVQIFFYTIFTEAKSEKYQEKRLGCGLPCQTFFQRETT